MDNWSRMFVSNICSDVVNQNVSFGHGTMETTYASGAATRIDDSDDEEIVMETLKTEPIDDAIEVGNGASSNANLNEIDDGTIATQNTSDAYNPNNG